MEIHKQTGSALQPLRDLHMEAIAHRTSHASGLASALLLKETSSLAFCAGGVGVGVKPIGVVYHKEPLWAQEVPFIVA